MSIGVVLGVANAAKAYSINTTETGKRIRWGLDTVALQLDPAFEEFLGPGEAFAAIEIGFDAWRGLPRVPDLVVQPGAPRHEPGHHGKKASNGVYLLKQWPYEPAKLAITVITYEMDTGRLLDADVLVNGEAKFALLDEGSAKKAHKYDLAAVLTHETGHVLGLGESEADPEATMWPYAMPDETQKRTLSLDDEEGVIESYLSAPPKAASGCGQLTVMGRARAPMWLLLSALVLASVVFRSGKRGKRSVRELLPLCALFLILGYGPQAAVTPRSELLGTLNELDGEHARALLAAAAQDADAQTRLDAAETLARAGTRDERLLAERLCGDADPRIAMRAHTMLGQLLARAPRATTLASSDEARVRLSGLRGASHALVRGRATKTAIVEVGGLIFTEYAVRDAAGQQSTLRVVGGERDGIGQRALDAELPPADDQDVVVAAQPDGTQRWAFEADGKLFGGHLGDGPAIAGAL